MNRLILIGNGFDLAHNMKTSYNDFLIWYLQKCFNRAMSGEYYDELIHISRVYSGQIQVGSIIDDMSKLVNFYYEQGLSSSLFEHKFYFKQNSTEWRNPFKVQIKSSLFKELINCSNLLWVDIENEFYKQLKKVLNESDPNQKSKKLNDLNLSLALIIEFLEEYLKTIEPKRFNQEYRKIFNSIVKNDEILTQIKEIDQIPANTLILNFNYTTTIENYINKDYPSLSNLFDVNYIHGQIGNQDNPLIFGFGDELDSDYSKMEGEITKGFFEFIKSFWYFKTSNYHKLVRFLDSEDFQVYILGHSCGLSDRTMLNMIFENENCKSIKIFYHKTERGNNYTSLTQEISRHFKDKSQMRRKIIPFNCSSPIPQVDN